MFIKYNVYEFSFLSILLLFSHTSFSALQRMSENPKTIGRFEVRDALSVADAPPGTKFGRFTVHDEPSEIAVGRFTVCDAPPEIQCDVQPEPEIQFGRFAVRDALSNQGAPAAESRFVVQDEETQ